MKIRKIPAQIVKVEDFK